MSHREPTTACTTLWLPVVLVLAALFAVGCSSAATVPAESATTSLSPSASTTAIAKPVELVVLITNDDGVEAVGLDVFARALGDLDNTTVHVVVPRENQSGAGDLESDGAVSTAPGRTINNVEATIVDGTPGDAVSWALRTLDVTPHVVIAGPNEGQNIGVFAEQSAIVGAGKVAARADIPSLAIGLGVPAPYDFRQGTQVAIDWLNANREALVAETLPAEVTLINIPNCVDGGSYKGLLEIPVAETFGDRDPFATDCTSEPDVIADDVDAFLSGYGSVSKIAAE